MKKWLLNLKNNDECQLNSSGGIGIGMALFLIFLVLKLTGHITWSWFWVCSPLLFSFVFFALVMLIFLIIAYMLGK